MGPRRRTRDEQKVFLHDLSREFQSVVTQALDARYYSHKVFRTTEGLNLATMITERNNSFARDLTAFGHLFEFLHFGEDDNESEEEEEDVYESEEEGQDGDGHGHGEDNSESSDDRNLDEDSRSQTSDPGFTTYSPYEYKKGTIRHFIDDDRSGTIHGIIEEETTVVVRARTKIHLWLQYLARDTQGFRLDAFSSDLFPAAMKEQSHKWEPLALGYISDIIQMVQSFIEKLLGALCHDDTVRGRLSQTILEHSLSTYREARRYVTFLLDNERARIPNTYNRAYYHKLQAITQQRAQAQLSEHAVPRQRDGRRVSAIPVGTVATHRTDNIRHNAEKLHDALRAYYGVALPRFVDNVCMQAAMFHLHGTAVLERDGTPLRFFSPDWVARLDDERLGAIAGEDEDTESRRNELEARIRDLEEGIEILRRP